MIRVFLIGVSYNFTQLTLEILRRLLVRTRWITKFIDLYGPSVSELTWIRSVSLRVQFRTGGKGDSDSS